MQKRNWILIAIAVGLGLFAVLIANAWFSGKEEQQARSEQQQKLVRIAVAAQPLEFGSALAAGNVRMQDWPAASVPEGAFRNLEDALRNNRVALGPIAVGEPVLASKVSGSDGRATLAALLPAGMRAVSLPVDATRGVAGFVLPGMTVDVLLTRQIGGAGANSNDLRTDVLLESVQVLAIDQSASAKESEPKVVKNVTVAVAPVDAQRVSLAQRIGTISLALRKIEEPAVAAAASGLVVTSRNLAGPNLVVAESRPAAATPQVFGGPLVPVQVAMPGGVQGPLGAIAAPMVPAGPAMIVIRGTQATSYPVAK